MQDTRKNLRLSSDLVDKIEAVAEAQGTNFSDLVRKTMWAMVRGELVEASVTARLLNQIEELEAKVGGNMCPTCVGEFEENYSKYMEGKV